MSKEYTETKQKENKNSSDLVSEQRHRLIHPAPALRGQPGEHLLAHQLLHLVDRPVVGREDGEPLGVLRRLAVLAVAAVVVLPVLQLGAHRVVELLLVPLQALV